MSNELVVTGPEISPADIFFDRQLRVTDWDAIMRDITALKIKSPDVLAVIKGMEPLAEHDARDFEHWRQQQILRLCLLCESNLPMVSNKTCKVCGYRFADPLQRYVEDCLHCREESEQLFTGGSRGSCEFTQPRFNPRSNSWGLLYYWSHGQENTFILWLADFFKTQRDAQMALQPFKHYEDWLAVKYNGMATSWLRFSSLVGIEDVMAMKLPLTPEQFREFLRSKIEAHMTQEHNILSYTIENALNDYEREQRE